MDRNAEARCKIMVPGGQFVIREYNTPSHFQFQAYFDHFLPYAFYMMQSENGYEALGIDFNSINALYGTVMGFVNIGTNDEIIVKDDVDLFQKIYDASMEIESPSLPFMEAFNPCCAFVAIRGYKYYIQHMNPESAVHEHVEQVIDKIGMRVPTWAWGEKPLRN